MKKLSVAFLTLVLVSACGGGSGGSSSGGAGGGNSAPLITSSNAYSIAEGETSIGTVVATDADGDSLTFSISGGPDASTVSVGSTSGALSFNAATDFEAPADANGDNVYNVTVRVGDGAAFDARDLVITVTNVVEAPVITSPASYTIEENITAIGTVTVSDAEGTVEFSVSGDDANLVSIASSGALSFVTAPDFENPADAGADNVYNFVVSAANSGGTVTQATSVTITDVDEDFIPEDLFFSEYVEGGGNNKYVEVFNGTGEAVLLDGYGIRSTPNGGDNHYFNEAWTAGTTLANGEVHIVCNEDAVEAITDNCDMAWPAFWFYNGNDTWELIKGDESAYTVIDVIGDGTPTYWDVCGDGSTRDHTLIKKDRTGGNTDWADSAGTSAEDCDWIVKEKDNFDDIGKHCLDSQAEVVITVNNSSGAVTVEENQTAVATVDATVTACKTLSYALSGADAALFAVSDAGVVTFVAAPDFEVPGDANADNIYNFTVTVSVGDLSETLDMVVTVSDVTGGNFDFSGNFGGATVDGNTYSFPSAAEGYAGFANNNAELYPITIADAKKITFTAAAATDDVNVYFRFEYKPYPEVEPSYNTTQVTVSGTEEKSYSVSVPSQGDKTFSSVIMYIVERDLAVTVKDVKLEDLNLVADFSGAFGGTTFADGVFTFPAAAEGYAGFANNNADLYPMTLEKGAAITFTGSVVEADVDVRFRFEKNPYPDVLPAYDTTPVKVTGTTDAEYTICVPAQAAENSYRSFLMYLNTRDAGVKVSNVKVTAYEEAVTDCASLGTQTDYSPAMTGPFGGFGVDGDTFTFPADAEGYAGVANDNSDIYPLAFEEAGKITFKASVPGGGDQEVRFRFEKNPYPDVNPAYDTTAVTVSGADEKTYEIAVPAQGTNTFRSFLMYLNVRDVATVVKDIVVTADKKPDVVEPACGNRGSALGGDNGGGTADICEAFGGTSYDDETKTYAFPTAAEGYAGFANKDTSIYPIKLGAGATITFDGAAVAGDVDVRFRFEKNPYPDVNPAYDTTAVTVSGSTETSYSITVPAQDAANTYSSFLMYLNTRDASVIVKNVVVTPN